MDVAGQEHKHGLRARLPCELCGGRSVFAFCLYCSVHELNATDIAICLSASCRNFREFTFPFEGFESFLTLSGPAIIVM
jgi:hypothetical protein